MNHCVEFPVRGETKIRAFENIMSLNVHPLSLDFVSRIRARQHIALFYQDQLYADLIDSWYIQSGLHAGETCVFATQGETGKIKARMLARGLDVDLFESENLMHILRISNASSDIHGVSKGVEKILNYLFSVIDPNRPARIVSEPWVGNLTKTDHIEDNMKVEKNVQAAFQFRECEDEYSSLKGFNGSLLCQYSIDGKNYLTRKWFQNHISNHHSSISAPKSGPGIFFSLHK